MAKKAVEQTGLIPRSIIRTFDRFRKQLFPETEKLIIQEFRISRYQFLVSIKCLFNLIFIPLIVNYLVKNFLLMPIIENLWNTQQPEIFLNLYQQDRAFQELKKFQEEIYFDYLLNDEKIDTKNNLQSSKQKKSDFSNNFPGFFEKKTDFQKSKFLQREIAENKFTWSDKTNLNFWFEFDKTALINKTSANQHFSSQKNYFTAYKLKNYSSEFTNENNYNNFLVNNYLFLENYNLTKLKNNCLAENYDFKKFNVNNNFPKNTLTLQEIFQQKLQHKTLELANYYNHQSILALTNLIGDFITFLVINLLLIYLKPEIIILKSFFTELIYSLNDTKKSFLLILGTDLLVGFHSPQGWEICLELILRHFGFPENKNFVFLFVASFPVLLDTIFKYWIFRYLNKISPSTVATYYSMIE